MTYGLLEGLRIIESSAFIAAPLAGLTLAEFGADVIRVDMIGGGIDYGRVPLAPSRRSLYWTGLNKGKRSIAIDLRRPEGRELVQALATAPDEDGGVLLTNIATSWLAHDLLASRRRDMITCLIQGNGDGSSAVDYTVNCATGYPAMTGGGSVNAPVNHVLPAWDVACAYQAAFSVLAAAGARRRTGDGAELRLALSDVAFSVLAHLGATAEAEVLGQERPSVGNHIYGAFGLDFGTADGKRIMVAAISFGQWKALVAACGMERDVERIERAHGLDLRNEVDRYEAREEIAAIVRAWCERRPLAEIDAVFERFGVCAGQYRTVRELVESDPRVSVKNPVFERIDTPGVGKHLAAGTPLRISGVARTPVRPAPLLGQDTDEILANVLRLDSPAIGKLHDEGIVAGADKDPTVTHRN
ncbi:2-methylfumaryl-CoA isomerase [Trinickia violacea]|uniref:2-methylfumaryl-CoA isomerase n=1 Tax=Trinickia violacea TaxID=2571746 RepID=A0A4P8J3A6_9BURK|nr:CoA transferase [Trinickia violacea]QCP54314.1 2-methylfumaryl-CoA isomerase [Trinickia violacea]